MKFTNHDIARYYDLSEVHYRRFWRLNKARSLHYGYWTPETKNFHQALLNVNKVMADLAGIKAGEQVLDAGCGVGGSALWLAQHRGCRVTGISLNEKQVQKAKVYARECGLQNQLQFETADYCHTPYAGASFDIVWAIESVCYANDKSEFIREAYRLLNPGGRIIVTDFFKAAHLEANAAAAVQKMALGWAVNDFATAEQFREQLAAAGFQSVQIHDAGKAILPSAKRLYRAYWLGKPVSVIYNLIRPNTTALAKNNVETAYWQYVSLVKGWWSYQIFTAVKPG